MQSVQRAGLLSRWKSNLKRKYVPTNPTFHTFGFSIVDDHFFSVFLANQNEARAYSIAKQWFSRYLTQKFRENWTMVSAVVNGVPVTSTEPSVGDEVVITSLILAIGENLAGNSVYFPEIVNSLLEKGLLRGTDAKRYQANQMTLAIIAWLTFLYRCRFDIDQGVPKVHVPHRSSFPWKRTIRAVTGGKVLAWDTEINVGRTDHPDFAFLNIKKRGIPSSTQSLPRKGFKVPGYSSRYNDETIERLFVSFRSLTEIGGIRILWTETLSSDLLFDPGTRQLLVFRFPSYCFLALESGEDSLCKRLEQRFINHRNPRISPDGFLTEVLLSYRLLFGSTKKQRNDARFTFRLVAPSDQYADPLLAMICEDYRGANDCQQLNCVWDIPELWSKHHYPANEFPFLGKRLLQIQSYVQAQNPHSFVTLWRDRRDQTQWWTFWVAIVIGGGLTLLFGLFSVALSVYQVYCLYRPLLSPLVFGNDSATLRWVPLETSSHTPTSLQSQPTFERSMISCTKNSQASEEDGEDDFPPKAFTDGDSSRSVEPLFLSVCIEKPNGSIMLVQIDVARITSDKHLFACLRQHHLWIRGKWLPMLKFRCLESINFVKFELWPSDEVDIQPFYDRRSLPPPDAQQYEYEPVSALPPVSSARLMHFWKTPDHPDGKGQTYLDRFPKRKLERLYVSVGERPVEGWGIQLNEGLNWFFIWMLIFVIVLIGSLVFGVTFAILEHDIQSAFSIASYVISFVTLGIGAISICGQRIVDRHYN